MDPTSGRTLTQAITTYSFIDAAQLDLDDPQVPAAETELLSKVVRILSEAAREFTARKYEGAISLYRAADSLIYAHLDPQWDPELGVTLRVSLPRDPALFDSLLSASAQWLNVLAVSTPASPVRPAVQPPVQMPLETTALHGAGLTPVSTNPTAAAQAIADVRLATIYGVQGNTSASSDLVARAESLDGALASGLASAAGLSAPTAEDTASQRADAPAPSAAPASLAGSLEPKGFIGGIARAITDRAATPAQDAASSVSQRIAHELTNLPSELLTQRQVGLVTGASPTYSVVTLQWAATGAPETAALIADLYAPHASATSLPDPLMTPGALWQHALTLPYYYFYVIPLALAECYSGLGNYEQAVTCYLEAAGYQYLNTAVEGPYIWTKLASAYLAWGDSCYEQGDTSGALVQYGKLLQLGSSAAPSSPLYTTQSLSTAAQIATQLLPQLEGVVQRFQPQRQRRRNAHRDAAAEGLCAPASTERRA